MAVINIELSEYDSLRESYQKAKDEIKQLKNEIDGLKNRSRVIIRTEPVLSELDINKTVDNFNRFNRYLGFEPRLAIQKAIEMVLNDSNVDYTKATERYVNFDDIKDKIEKQISNSVKEQYDNKLKELDFIKEQYKADQEKIRQELSDEYSNEIKKLKNKLESDYKEKLDSELKRLTESLQMKVTDFMNLYDREKSLTKSLHENNVELNKTIQKLQNNSHNKIEDLNNQINKLNNQINEKDTEIAKLKKRSVLYKLFGWD